MDGIYGVPDRRSKATKAARAAARQEAPKTDMDSKFAKFAQSTQRDKRPFAGSFDKSNGRRVYNENDRKFEHKAKKQRDAEIAARAAKHGTTITEEEAYEEEDDAAEEDEDDEEEEDDSPPLPEVDATKNRNPMLEVYRQWTASAPSDMRRVFDPRLSFARRAELLALLPTRAQRKYGWAVPDDRALGLLYSHGPVVEVAAGRGYWGWALRRFAADAAAAGLGTVGDEVYVGYDAAPYMTADADETAAEANKREFARVLRAEGLDPEAEAAALEAEADGAGKTGDGEGTEEEEVEERPSKFEKGKFDYQKWKNAKRGGKHKRREKERAAQRARAYARAAAAASYRDDAECPSWIEVKRAGPEAAGAHPDRALLLCYPDEYDGYVAGDDDDEDDADKDSKGAAAKGEDTDGAVTFSGRSVGLKALQAYSGDTVIVVGEAFGQTMQGGNPWGRSGAPEFQAVRLLCQD
jgi:hypothetical protein